MADQALEAPALEPVSKDTVYEKVYQGLREALMNGRFPPGQSFTLRSLSEAFGTSAMPVREALRRLAAERAVMILPNRSAMVPPLTRARLDDLRYVRCTIEGEAAALAVTRILPAERARLAAIMREMDNTIGQNEVLRYLALNREFHFTYYRAAHSDTLMPIIESLWLQAGPTLNLLVKDIELTMPAASDHHADAMSALEDGDPEGARRAFAADINDAADFILKLLDKG